MANVAVVLTGHLRCWQAVLPNFKQMVLDVYQPDTFIHTWTDEGYWLVEEDARGVLHQASPQIDVAAVQAAYNPISLVVEDLNEFLPAFGARVVAFTNYLHRPRNTVSMYYKMGAGMQALERHCLITGKQYDLVIRMRPDMILHQWLPELAVGTFYTFYHPNHLGTGAGDMFQAGSYEAVRAFCTIGTRLEELYTEIGQFCPHRLSEHFIRKLGLNWSQIHIAKTIQHSPAGSYAQAPGHDFKDGYIAAGGILVKT